MACRRYLAAAIVLAGASCAAYAGGIVVGRKLEIDVDPKNVERDADAVWAKFGGVCAIKDWHPAVADCVESVEGDAAYRTLTLKDGGGAIKEKMIESGKRSYKYEIVDGPLPVKNHVAQFTITPDDDDEDEINLVWTTTFDAKDKPDKEARAVIDGIFKDGLASIESMLKKE